MKRSETPFKSARDQHPLPFKLDGSFSWLRALPMHKEHVGVMRRRRLQTQLKKVEAAAMQHDITLPPEFVAFMADVELQARIRSIIDCYLGMGTNLLPLRDGYLLRFLNDSQGCAFWYLFLRPSSESHAVVICYDFFDADDPDSADLAELHPKKFVFDSPTFETWLCRFWLENEIMFAHLDNTALPEVGEKFIRLYTNHAYLDDLEDI